MSYKEREQRKRISEVGTVEVLWVVAEMLRAGSETSLDRIMEWYKEQGFETPREDIFRGKVRQRLGYAAKKGWLEGDLEAGFEVSEAGMARVEEEVEACRQEMDLARMVEGLNELHELSLEMEAEPEYNRVRPVFHEVDGLEGADMGVGNNPGVDWEKIRGY